MEKKQTGLKLSKLRLNSTKPHYIGHRERMRQRLAAKCGFLADYEILEMLLYYVLPRKDTKALAKRLIAHFGSIRSVIFSDKSNLKRIEGAGKACITMFSLIREAFIRLNLDKVKESAVIASSTHVADFYKNIFFNMKHEQLRIMFLNSKNLLITEEVFQDGTINQTPIYPRMIIQRAFELGAAAIIMVHNHPSGDPQPSRQDIIMTRALKDVASKLDIAFLDHLIIGRKDIFSMKEHSII